MEVVQQLDAIAKERQIISEKLQALNLKEAELLASLVQMEKSQNALNNSENLVPDTMNKLIVKDNSGKQVPKQQSTKQSSDRKTTRTLSAPPKSSPSVSSRHRTPSTSKRVPLADKTEESLAAFDSTPIFVAIDPIAFPEKSEETTEQKERSASPAHSKSKPPQPYNTVLVPTKFHDELCKGKGFDERGRPRTPRQKHALPLREASRETPQYATTPGVLKDYEVPHTVKRKKWDF